MSNVRLVRGALCLLVLACSLVSTSHAAVVALKRDTGLTAGGATDARFNSATVVTTTVADAGIYTSGNARWMNAGRCDRPANAAYMLYKFDLSSIPAGSTINLAQLRLYHTAGNGGQGNGDVSVVLTHDWTEGPGTTDMISYPGAAGGVSYAHFNGRNTDAFQDANGGTTGPQQTWSASSNAWFDITIDAGSPLAPSSTPTGTGYHVIPVTSHVQQWVSGIRPNYGWAQIRGYWDFHCSEAGTADGLVLAAQGKTPRITGFPPRRLPTGGVRERGTEDGWYRPWRAG